MDAEGVDTPRVLCVISSSSLLEWECYRGGRRSRVRFVLCDDTPRTANAHIHLKQAHSSQLADSLVLSLTTNLK